MLLVHAPYPGTLKFEAQPSSLLTAAAPLAQTLAAQGRLAELAIVDPPSACESFFNELERILETGRIEVLCISSSTAAIQEAHRVARLARKVSPRPVHIIGGGPHEDDIDVPMAERLPEFDLSVAGDGEEVLAPLVLELLDGGASAQASLDAPAILSGLELRGQGVVSRRDGKRFEWGGGAPTSVDVVLTRPWMDKSVHFEVFPGRETLPLMVSRGCSYGQCTFCAEASGGRQRVVSSFEPLEGLLDAWPNAALYFQDSIFPTGRRVQEELLPMLAASGRPWGCQVYLPSLSERWVHALSEHGCIYLYTGIESGSPSIRAAVGKAKLGDSMVGERIGWMRDAGLRVGISLMFGVFHQDGRMLETEESVRATEALIERVYSSGVSVAGVYPNVMTVLPGTSLARSLQARGASLDFYSPPRTPALDAFEDGGVGFTGALPQGLLRRAARLGVAGTGALGSASG
ncbi:MAG: radical SAM protein [Planctomycetota bacterium]